MSGSCGWRRWAIAARPSWASCSRRPWRSSASTISTTGTPWLSASSGSTRRSPRGAAVGRPRPGGAAGELCRLSAAGGRSRPAAYGQVVGDRLAGLAELGHRRPAGGGRGLGHGRSRHAAAVLQRLWNLVSYDTCRADAPGCGPAFGDGGRRPARHPGQRGPLSALLLSGRLRPDAAGVVLGNRRPQRSGVLGRSGSTPGSAT